jgi:CSLREA domain-containing protein
MATAPRAHASTYTVNSTADAVDQTPGDDVCATAGGACTLRAAVQEANAHAGPDVVSLPPGVFLLTLLGAGEDLGATGDLDVAQELEVRGAGKDATIIDAFKSDRHFDVFGVPFALRDVTLRNGGGGGGPAGGAVYQSMSAPLTFERVGFERNLSPVAGAILQADGPLTIADSTFEANAAGTAAAVLMAGADNLTITNSTFTDNGAPSGVGTVLISNSGTATIQGCTFSGNLAQVAATVLSSGGSLTIADSTFQDNVAVGPAGGPLYSGAGAVVLTNVRSLGNVAQEGPGGYVMTTAGVQVSGSEFSDNFSLNNFGGLTIQAGTDVVVQSSAFRRNGALNASGGLFVSVAGGSLTLTDVEASENSATTAGGIFATTSAAVTMTRVRAINNGASPGIGGGIYTTATTDLTLTDSTVDGNMALQIGGLYAIAGGAMTVTGSTISNNRAVGIGSVGGGAYMIAGAPSTIMNSTFSGNVADLQVGGLFAGGDIAVRNTTFVNNEATMASAILNAGTVSLTNSIVAGPAASHCAGAAITSLGFNIDSTNTCNLSHPSDRSNLDPQLGPLQNNGGPTFTHLAGTGSPALDTGHPSSCPATDQRGQARPMDADGDGTATCDVGATEFLDLCPGDPNKTEPGACGCGVADTDATDANGVPDCFVNGEFKARLAHGKEMVNALTGDETDDGMAQELMTMTDLLDDYMTAHPDLQLTGTKPKPSKLLKRLGKAVKRATKAKGKKVVGAKKKALKAFDALDALVAPQA